MHLTYNLFDKIFKMGKRKIDRFMNSNTVKCCNCKKCFFDTGGLGCPHCHFPILREKKLLSFDLWDKIKAIFKSKE